MQDALDALPVQRRMRWGNGETEFVRPVHWVLMLHGRDVVEGRIAGHAAGRRTRGHRFLADRELAVDEPASYLSLLETEGCVLADFAARRQRIVSGVAAAAAEAGGVPVATCVAGEVQWLVPPDPGQEWSARNLLIRSDRERFYVGDGSPIGNRPQ